MQQASRIEELTSRGPVPGAASRNVRRRLFGLITRKERWGFSWKGWLLALVLLIGVAISLGYGVYPFLAVTHRANTDVLIVEGWIHEYAIRAAINEFEAGHYERVYTTGGPIAGM